MSERIQKWLSTAGVASRREIERMIEAGRIQVNGQDATLGQKIGPRDRVSVDGRPVQHVHEPQPTRVLIYKKRVGEVVTREDPDGRRTIFRKLPRLASGRWIAVGRLDINTSGLLLLTNDGELARRLMHPSFEIERRYAVRVFGELSPEQIRALRKGVELDDGVARFDTIMPISAAEDDEDDPSPPAGYASNHWFEVTLRQGRNRMVRRLFASQGVEVSRLIRIGYGPVALGRGMRSGRSREAAPEELSALLAAVGMPAVKKVAKGAARGAVKARPRSASAARRGSDSEPLAKATPGKHPHAYLQKTTRRLPPDEQKPAARRSEKKADEGLKRRASKGRQSDSGQAAAPAGSRGEARNPARGKRHSQADGSRKPRAHTGRSGDRSGDRPDSPPPRRKHPKPTRQRGE